MWLPNATAILVSNVQLRVEDQLEDIIYVESSLEQTVQTNFINLK